MKQLLSLRGIILLLLSLTLAACAFDQSETDPNRKRDLENREKLLRAFDSIQGVYEGEFETLTRTEMIRMTISYTEVEVGKTQDGEIRYQPELRARLSRLDRDVFDIYMNASLISETSDLTLTTANGGGDTLYIRGIIKNEMFSAPVRNRDGSEIGTVNLQLISRDVIAPPDGNGNETYDRIKSILQRVQGKYTGTVNRREGKKLTPFDIEIVIRIEDRKVNSQILPFLVAYSQRDDGFSKPAKHEITYNGDRDPIELIFDPQANAVGYSAWSLKATFVNRQIKGTIVYPNFTAEFVATPPKGD